MWYERSWRWAKEHLTVTVPGAVLIFAATFIVMLAVNAGEAGAAWVQAVGSVAAIFVAIAIAENGRRDQERQKNSDVMQLDLAHEMRLWCFLWECGYLATQLLEQLKEDRTILPGTETVALLNRLLDRVVMNFDDDLNVWRLNTASDGRYILGSYIHACMRRATDPEWEAEFFTATSNFQEQIAVRLSTSRERLDSLKRRVAKG